MIIGGSDEKAPLSILWLFIRFSRCRKSDCRYFALNEIPELSVSRTSQEQIKMCFDAYNSPNWEVVYD